ncbi:hypothetical protein Btru_046462 [Bulinus truncatus]|nr:hypothetical protein Btru_046462 [Bulinus truncatus]
MHWLPYIIERCVNQLRKTRWEGGCLNDSNIITMWAGSNWIRQDHNTVYEYARKQSPKHHCVYLPTVTIIVIAKFVSTNVRQITQAPWHLKISLDVVLDCDEQRHDHDDHQIDVVEIDRGDDQEGDDGAHGVEVVAGDGQARRGGPLKQGRTHCCNFARVGRHTDIAGALY